MPLIHIENKIDSKEFYNTQKQIEFDTALSIVKLIKSEANLETAIVKIKDRYGISNE